MRKTNQPIYVRVLTSLIIIFAALAAGANKSSIDAGRPVKLQSEVEVFGGVVFFLLAVALSVAILDDWESGDEIRKFRAKLNIPFGILCLLASACLVVHGISRLI